MENSPSSHGILCSLRENWLCCLGAACIKQSMCSYVYLIWCTKTVDLSNMGRQTLISHMSSSWCAMTLDIWRSLLCTLFVAINFGKYNYGSGKAWKTLEFFSRTLWPPRAVDTVDWYVRLLILENLISRFENKNSRDLVENSSCIGITRLTPTTTKLIRVATYYQRRPAACIGLLLARSIPNYT